MGITIYPIQYYGIEWGEALPGKSFWLHGAWGRLDPIPNFGKGRSRFSSVQEVQFATKSWRVVESASNDADRRDVFLVRLDASRLLDFSRQSDCETVARAYIESLYDYDDEEDYRDLIDDIVEEVSNLDQSRGHGFMYTDIAEGIDGNHVFWENYDGAIDASDDQNVEIWNEDPVLKIRLH